MRGVDRQEQHHVVEEDNNSLKSWNGGERALEVLLELVDRDDSYSDQNVECCKGEDNEGIDEDMSMDQNQEEDMHLNWEGGRVDLKVVEHEEGTHKHCYMGKKVNYYTDPLIYSTRLHYS